MPTANDRVYYYRTCNVCKALLYEDEPGNFCQDCRGVLRHIATEIGVARQEPEAYRLARDRAHAERIALITAWVEATK